MMSDEQLQDMKMHLLKQLDNFPEDQRKIVKHKILSMNNQEMVAFLKENGLDYEKENREAQQCIFCALAKGKLKSYKIDENSDYVAILELNPLSRGHLLILPKKHVSIDKLSEGSVEFAKKIATIIFNKLNPKDVQFQKNEILGHAALEVIPVYDDEKQERKRASDEELAILQSELVDNKSDAKIVSENKKELLRVETKAEGELPSVDFKEEPAKISEENKPQLPRIKSRVGWL